MTTKLRKEIRQALSRRGDISALTSQGVQSVPAPLMLADLVVRECVLAVQRGLDGWAPVETLPERLKFRVGTSMGALEVLDEDPLWDVIRRVWVSGDAPGIEGTDQLGLPIQCDRVLTLGAIGADIALDLAAHIAGLDALQATQAVLEDGEVGVPVVGRMAALDGPTLGPEAIWGLAGVPLRVRVEGGEVPTLSLLVELPLGRMAGGLLGARGLVVEDVRGVGHYRDLAMTMPFVLGANLALGRLDDDAERQGGVAMGFAGRVSALADHVSMSPADLLDEVTTVLPHLGRQLKDRQDVGDDFSAKVIMEGIAALVGRTKASPCQGRALALQFLAAGLSPHVRPSGVYWLPTGEYRETLPEEALDRVLAMAMAVQL